MGEAFPIEVRPEGLYLAAIDLYLDPDRAVRGAFVSHAHADHTAADLSGFGAILASPETLALIEARRASRPDVARALGWDETIEVPIDRAYGGGTARLGIAPAGHILGAAQLVIDHPRGRLVYTGDYRTGPGETHATGAPIACDELIVECTFGLPIFRFPPREQVLGSIVAWCRARIADGETPVLLGYALGKSQALVRACLDQGLPVVAHGAVYRMCAAYESLGVPMGVGSGALRPYADEKKRKNEAPHVLVVPPQAQSQPMIRKRKDARVAYCSGWALVDAAIEQRRADAGFALSDHADYDDLMTTIAKTGARHVYVTHGDDVETFAHLVGLQGVAVTPLGIAPIDAHEERSS